MITTCRDNSPELPASTMTAYLVLAGAGALEQHEIAAAKKITQRVRTTEVLLKIVIFGNEKNSRYPIS